MTVVDGSVLASQRREQLANVAAITLSLLL